MLPFVVETGLIRADGRFGGGDLIAALGGIWYWLDAKEALVFMPAGADVPTAGLIAGTLTGSGCTAWANGRTGGFAELLNGSCCRCIGGRGGAVAVCDLADASRTVNMGGVEVFKAGVDAGRGAATCISLGAGADAVADGIWVFWFTAALLLVVSELYSCLT